jgi:hypothetical protein
MVTNNNPYAELTEEEMNKLIEKILDEIWADVSGDLPDAGDWRSSKRND